MPFWYLRFALCVLMSGVSAHGVSAEEKAYAVVDSVRMPAWVSRHGISQPLEPGKALRNRDRVITGADARVVIQLAEGSAVKLGENAQLELNALGRREGKVFTTALDVAKGAFRFTTGVFSRTQPRRAVNIRIATMTAGIRGADTDLWGKADELRDLICLLEGRSTVIHPLGEAREMSEPLSFYAASKGAAPDPVGKADAEEMVAWAAQTELQPGSGYVQRGGQWKVELATAGSEADALTLYDRARAAGYAVRIKPLAAGGGYRYSVRVTQLPSKAEAEILASKLVGALELASPAAARY